MEKINSFKDLMAWQEGHKLVLIIYEITKKIHKIINGLIKGCRLRIFPSLTHHSLFIILFLTSLFLIPNSAFAATINKPSNFLTINTGLVGHWTFDGPRMISNVADSSGQGNIGYLSHGGSGTTTIPGKLGQGLSFDGVNDYVSMGDTLNLSLPITFSLWVKLSSVSGYQSLITTDKGVKQTTFFHSGAWFAISSGIIDLGYGSNTICSSGGRRNKSSVTTLLPNRWYFLTGVINGATDMFIYINGVNDGGTYTGTGGAIQNTNRSASIGLLGECAGSPYPDYYFNGSLDDPRVYNRALSAGEIKQLYNIGSAKFAVTPALPLTSGLVGWWTMDGKDTPWTSATAATTLDKSGNGNTGTLTSMAQATSPVAGKIGQALYFTNSNVTVASNSLDNMNIFTYCAWVYPYTAGENALARIMSKGVTSPGKHFYISSNSDKTYTAYVTRSTTNAGVTTSNNAAVFNKWQQVCSTYSEGDGLRIFVNGTEASYASRTVGVGTTSADSSGEFYIGARSDGAADWYGRIDDVRIYNRVLSATEITQLYNLGSAKFAVTPALPLTSGLVGWWTFDGPKMLTNVADSSGQGNIGYLSHGGSGTTTVPGKLGQALSFDGVNDYVTRNAISNVGVSGVFTISLWFKAAGSTDNIANLITNTLNQSNNQVGITFQTFDDGTLTAGVFNGATYLGNKSVAFTDTSKWHFIAVTWDGTTMTASLDNVPMVGTYYPNSTGLTNTLHIGGCPGCAASRFFNGTMDDVRIYNRVLSAGEIKQLYNLGR